VRKELIVKVKEQANKEVANAYAYYESKQNVLGGVFFI